jgi:hypothetical protein
MVAASITPGSVTGIRNTVLVPPFTLTEERHVREEGSAVHRPSRSRGRGNRSPQRLCKVQERPVPQHARAQHTLGIVAAGELGLGAVLGRELEADVKRCLASLAA